MIELDELRQICLAFAELAGDWITEDDILLRPEATTFLREFGQYKTLADMYEHEFGLGKHFEVLCLHNDIMMFATELSDDSKRDIGYWNI